MVKGNEATKGSKVKTRVSVLPTIQARRKPTVRARRAHPG
jgi:hypothetical protein